MNPIVESCIAAIEQETARLDTDEYEEVLELLIERLRSKLLDIQ